MCSVDCFPCWKTNHLIVLPLTSSLKIELDPLEIELVAVEPNPVGAWFLTWRHDRGHSSIDSVCWKCKWARICFSATDSKLLDFFSIAAATSSVCKAKVSSEGIVTDVACFDNVQ